MRALVVLGKRRSFFLRRLVNGSPASNACVSAFRSRIDSMSYLVQASFILARDLRADCKSVLVKLRIDSAVEFDIEPCDRVEQVLRFRSLAKFS